MKLPLVLINFKTYAEGTGKNALRLTKICERVSKKYNANISVAPQDADIYRISSKVKVPVYAQGIDSIEPGPYTGHKLALAVKDAGAIGTLVNHSENRLSPRQIKEVIGTAKKNNLISVVCVSSMELAKIVSRLNPDLIAYEDPELIGTGNAVSKTSPESVKRFVEILAISNPRIIPMCGAGISNDDDVKTALELGAKGVIVASAIVRAKNPRRALEEIVSGLELL